MPWISYGHSMPSRTRQNPVDDFGEDRGRRNECQLELAWLSPGGAGTGNKQQATRQC